MFTVRKHIEIDAGHRVPYHGSKCRNLHGHRYRITAVVAANELVAAETQASDAGMVLDFGVIKTALMKVVHDRCDHKLLLWEKDELIQPWRVYPERPLEIGFQQLVMNLGISAGVVILPCIPTAEELARYWGELIVAELKDSERLRVIAIEVQETPTSVATWERNV